MTMKFRMAAITALFWASTAQAREASLIDFVHPGEDIEQVPPIDQSMRSHLEGLAIAKDMVGLQETGSSIGITAQWQSSAPCLAANYSPAWWLPRDVEVRRAAQYPLMASIACEHGLPTNLLDAVITQESGYNAWAISRAGAMGMMQIMPGTARVLGLAQPFDAVANMRAGARYLRQQIDRFGRIDLALAAYNSGPERRSLKAGYIPAIPETQNYVRTITTNWARLASRSPELVTAHDRGTAAMQAAYASGYRRVELISYQGSNAANPI